jgi:hypothetical protein
MAGEVGVIICRCLGMKPKNLLLVSFKVVARFAFISDLRVESIHEANN